MVFALTDYAASVAHIEDGTDTDERVWVMIHTLAGPFLMCAWYRPPHDGESDVIARFGTELERLRSEALGVVVVGDLNIHHVAWLTYSSHTAAAGRQLQGIVRESGLTQHFKTATRGPHLLDLVISDVKTSAKVLCRIADHGLILATLNLQLPRDVIHTREVWRFADADWEGMDEALGRQDWSHLDHMSPCEGAAWLQEFILETMQQWIGKREVKDKKPTHPWMNNVVLELVDRRVQARGTPGEEAANWACSQGILEQYRIWAAKSRQELLTMDRGSKIWWSKSRALLQGKERTCSVPSLKTSKGGDHHLL